MDIIKYKIKSVVFGHAVGDALGVPVEFCRREELTQKPVTDMVGYGTYPYPEGSWSDDTSMSLASLDSFASGQLDFDDIMFRFGKWYYDNEYTPTGRMFDVGNVCNSAIANYFMYHKNATECGLVGEGSNGNGSLMRIYPFVLLIWCSSIAQKNCESVIEKASALTHAHDRSKLGCKIYAIILLHLLEVSDKSSIKQALNMAKRKYENNSEYCYYQRLFTDDFADLPCNKIKSTGYIVDTLESAIWCVMTTNTYRDCVLKAVNLGDDTDTVAAIAGSMAGVLYGYDSIPKEWLDVLKRREYIESICDRVSEKIKYRNILVNVI